MKCPHCGIAFHDNWDDQIVNRSGQVIGWKYRTAVCPACKKITIAISEPVRQEYQRTWRMVYPLGTGRDPIPLQVPVEIAQDYTEACLVLPISAKASAALSRRCLQNILRSQGYKTKDLAREIQALLDEPDPRKAIPETLRGAIDGIRSFGNFSAHPITDVTSLQIIDVEDHEAEWCLEILEEVFQHFYVRPAQAAARKAALDAKLAAAGKPPSK